MKPGLRLALAALAVAATASTVVAIGCTSSSSGGSASSYCSALSSYASRCNLTDPCTTATIQSCGTFSSAASPAWAAAIASCASEVTCDGGGTLVNACVSRGISSITPSAAQEKLAQDYCAACPTPFQTPAQCQQSFYSLPGDGALGGPGDFLISYSDTVATSVDTQCASGLADAGLFGCSLTFLRCAETQATNAYPEPAACSATTFDAAAFTFDAAVFTFDAAAFSFDGG